MELWELNTMLGIYQIPRIVFYETESHHWSFSIKSFDHRQSLLLGYFCDCNWWEHISEFSFVSGLKHRQQGILEAFGRLQIVFGIKAITALGAGIGYTSAYIRLLYS
jgi:hypothetical protein